MPMHDGQINITGELVAALIADQFPRLVALPMRRIASTGTVNAIYRLGDELYARLPLLEAWGEDIQREWRWLPQLASSGLSLHVPQPEALGRPAAAYPSAWAIYRWIDGHPYADALIHDERQAAADLARFVRELRRIDPVGAPRAGRRPLRELDAVTRDAIRAAGASIDRPAAMAAWDRALEAPPWSGTPVWIHTDLLKPNLLVRDGRLHAVLDWGGAGAGDPAADVIAAWSLFGPAGRATYRAALDVDDDIWMRARGFALHQAALIIPYYRETNPAFVDLARLTVEQVVADASA